MPIIKYYTAQVCLAQGIAVYTTSWGCWKHPFGIPGVRSMILKSKLHKESKNRFKTINYRCYPVMIFSKNCFRSKKIIKTFCWFLKFHGNIYGYILGFLIQFWFYKHRSDTWDPKGMFSAPSGCSVLDICCMNYDSNLELYLKWK